MSVGTAVQDGEGGGVEGGVKVGVRVAKTVDLRLAPGQRPRTICRFSRSSAERYATRVCVWRDQQNLVGHTFAPSLGVPMWSETDGSLSLPRFRHRVDASYESAHRKYVLTLAHDPIIVTPLHISRVCWSVRMTVVLAARLQPPGAMCGQLLLMSLVALTFS